MRYVEQRLGHRIKSQGGTSFSAQGLKTYLHTKGSRDVQLYTAYTPTHIHPLTHRPAPTHTHKVSVCTPGMYVLLVLARLIARSLGRSLSPLQRSNTIRTNIWKRQKSVKEYVFWNCTLTPLFYRIPIYISTSCACCFIRKRVSAAGTHRSVTCISTKYLPIDSVRTKIISLSDLESPVSRSAYRTRCLVDLVHILEK